MTQAEINRRQNAVAALLKENPKIKIKDAAQILGISETAFRRYRDKACADKDTSVLTTIHNNRYEHAYKSMKDRVKDLEEALEIKTKELQNYASLASMPKNMDIRHIPQDTTEVVPVIVASDWHIEETVTAAITNGKNEYNLKIAEDSVNQFFSKACDRVLQTREHSVVNTVVLAILGDIINGVLREEDLETNQVTPVEAVTLARALIHSGIKTLRDRTGCRIHVICCVGNHGRLTDKIHYSNQVHCSLEYLMYKTLERDFQDTTGITFDVPESPYRIQSILGVRVRFHHGHIIKVHGGIGGIAIPVLRKVAQMNTIEDADLDVIGHFHTFQMFNKVIVNGSLVGSNGFSMSMGLPHDIPKQTYFEIDSKYGLTAIRPICIDREVTQQVVKEI